MNENYIINLCYVLIFLYVELFAAGNARGGVKMDREEFLQSARMMHYAIRLPVRLYEKEELVLDLPGGPEAPTLLTCSGGPGTWAAFSNRPKPQYVIGKTGERSICYLPDKVYALIIGPFYGDNTDERELDRMLQMRYASVKERDTMRACLKALPRLSEDNFYYTGRLLLKVFAPQDPKQSVGSPAIPSPDDGTLEELYRHPPYFLEREISRCIAEQDEPGALSVLNEVNRLERATLANDPLRSLKNSLICSCSQFTRAAIAGGALPDAAFSLSDLCILTIEGNTETKRLAAYEYEMVRRFISLIRRRKEGGVSDVVRAAMIYADEHLFEPVTVDGIAQGIFVHPSYLSTCFKKETGEPLSGYIRRKRVREAEKMLASGHEPMAAIAAACQFCSQSHLIQVFKKQTGLTPEQFRRAERIGKGRL
jgi:AraC-like DNA-binding protein